MSMDDVRELCVIRFPTSTKRATIMAGLEHVTQELNLKSIEGELWIDGSFLTRKTDPEDVDLVLRIRADFYDNATPEQQQVVDWLADDLVTPHKCDSYFFVEWDESHPLYWTGEYMYAYWMKQWGFSRDGSAEKGIADVELTGASP